jgi:hypothetical protein
MNGTTTDRMVVWSLNISKPRNGHSDERCARRCILPLATGCLDLRGNMNYSHEMKSEQVLNTFRTPQKIIQRIKE